MTYERPAIDRRVQVNGPLINGPVAGSTPVLTPTWTPHEAEPTER
jgi:hypothetical protein